MMSGFFNGWRRKLGVLTLIMACVFMGGWVRSEFIQDTITISPDSDSHIHFSSASGRLIILVMNDIDNVIPFWGSRQVTFDGWRIDGNNASLGKDNVPNFQFNLFNANADNFDERLVLRYWSIVVPLTLISAYLLLSKPRSLAAPCTNAPAPSEKTA
jgi:hypothetical protein